MKKYKKDPVIKSIEDKISLGYYKTGDKLPTEKELTKEYNVSRMTLRQALNYFETKGIIKKVKGSGSYIEKIPLQRVYIVISTNEIYLTSQASVNYRRYIEILKEKITQAGYIPYLYGEKNSKLYSYGATDPNSLNLVDISIDAVAGVISLRGNELSYEEYSNKEIPVVTVLNDVNSIYPGVNCNYITFYNTVLKLLRKHKFYNNVIFTYESGGFQADFGYICHDYFSNLFSEKYQCFKTSLQDNGKLQTREMEKYIKQIEKAPDCIVFIDDYMYTATVPLFEKYSDIFQNTHIITLSNDGEFYPENYKICKLRYYPEKNCQKAVDMLLKLIHREPVINCLEPIPCEIINEENLV